MDNLETYLSKEVKLFWEKNQSPFLLSNIGGKFNKEDIKKYTKGKNVVSWINSIKENLDFKLVFDPNNKVRIGLIPSTENFSYTIENNEITNIDNREVTLKFLSLLQQKLTYKELQEVNIPIFIIMKLL